MPTLKTVTLGCKVNQYETEYVRGGLESLGYREAVDGEPADLYLVNTCTVTGEADLKSRKAIRQIARQNPRAEIIVMGCYATRAAEEVAALPGVVEVITDKRQLPELLARLGVVDVPEGIASFGRRHRAYVKVQDGCRMQCSYCIIPTVRPELISRPVDEVLAEIGRLVERGYREIVLTGIHLGHYGVDLEEQPECVNAAPDLPHPAASPPPSPRGRGEISHPRNLAALVRRILSIEGEFRLRISSIEAVEVTDEFVELMAAEPERICPHLHVSMQSGSDAVLERMQRRSRSGRFVEKCRRIRQSLDEPALTTDVIVGFPGETDGDFEATCRVVEEVGFSKLHVFRFSPREGTPAAEMPDRVPGTEMHRRAAELSRIGRRLRDRYLRRLVGRRLQVLVETAAADRPGTLVGTACRYVPVELPGGPERLGRLVRVTAGSAAGGRIRAEPGR
jgi:threonylcarbamoyladenosine tRNA methylthiotransferase MtaB